MNVNKSELSNITHYSSQFVLLNVWYYSITEDDPPAMKHGCLVWWTLHTNQPLDTWKLSPSMMLPHCCPLFRPMLPMQQQYIQTSGRHIDKWQVCQVFPLIPQVTFVDPVSGTHTQNIESYWGKAKRKLKNMKGCHASQLPIDLDKVMWREHFGQTTADAFNNIMLHISEQYTF